MDSRECPWRLCGDSLLSTFRKKCHGLKTPYFGEFCVSLKTPGSLLQITQGPLRLKLIASWCLKSDTGFGFINGARIVVFTCGMNLSLLS